MEGRARAKEAALPGRKGASYSQPFHDRKWKGRLRRCPLESCMKQVNGCVSLKPRLVNAGEKDLTWKAGKALAVSVLSPHHTLESLGEYFKLNTNLVPTFKSV